MEHLKEQYKIVDFYTEEETGIITNSLEEAQITIINLEKETTTRYIPLLLEELDETIDEIY